MDRDRELARLVREAGLVPVERVRESLRRVGTLRSKGRETNLLRELVRTGQLSEDDARRVEQMWRAEQDRSESVKLVRLRASERQRHRSPGSDGTLPQAGGVRLSEAERSLLHEQARIVDLAKLVSRDDLRAAYLEVAQQRLQGVEVDLLTYLEANGRISTVHARAVRAKMQLDKKRPPKQGGDGEAGPARKKGASGRSRKVAAAADAAPAMGRAAQPPPEPPPATLRNPSAGAHDQSFPDLAVVGLEESAPAASASEPPRTSARGSAGHGERSAAATTTSTATTPAEALRRRDRELARILVEEKKWLTEPQLASLQRRMDAARRRGRRTDLAQELLNAELLGWPQLEPVLQQLPRVPGDMSAEERLAEAKRFKSERASSSGSAASSGTEHVKPLGGGPLKSHSTAGASSSRVRRVPAGESADAHEPPPPVSLPRTDSAGGQHKVPEPPAAADSTGMALPPERLVTYIPQVKLPRSLPTGAGRRRTSAKERAKQRKPKQPAAAKPQRPARFDDAESPPRTHAVATDDEDTEQPLGALEGDVGEDRLSVRRALGLGSGVHLRDDEEPAPAAEEWGDSEIGADSAESAARGPLAARHSKYKLLREIAKGGMGSVARVEDRDIRRVVAMKRLENWRDRDAMERFIEEAQVTGQLEHPNIVPVHDIGLDPQGRLFFTMKYVHGESLAQVLEQIRRRSRNQKNKGTREITYRDFNLARLLQVFLKVCDAISFAHAKGVIHRDLKPENVMIGAFGEVLVMDWGVAKLIEPKVPEQESPADSRDRVKRRRSSSRLPRMGGLVHTSTTDYDRHATSESGRVRSSRAEDSALQSQTGDIVGTAMYMAPEQARGEVGSLDERTDVYALGAMLYEILTLAPPFDGHNVFMILRAVLDEPLVPPRTRSPERTIPVDLERIVMRAMEKNRADRYPTVEALKADVLSYVDGRMIEGAPYTSVQRVGRWLRRPTKLAGVAVVLLLAVAAAWVVGTHPALLGDDASSQGTQEDARQLLQRLDEVQTRARTAEATARHASMQERRMRSAWRNDLRQQLDRYVAAGSLREAQATLSRWQRLTRREADPALAVAQANVMRLRAGGGAVKVLDAPLVPATAWMPVSLVTAEARTDEPPARLLVRANGPDLFAYDATTGTRLIRIERLPHGILRLEADPTVRGRLHAYDQRGGIHRLDLAPLVDALARASNP